MEKSNYAGQIGRTYARVNALPDKICARATMVKMLDPLRGTQVLELASGDGWFSDVILDAQHITCIDVDEYQLAQGRKKRSLVPRTFVQANMFDASLPHADRVLGPWIANYAPNEEEMSHFFARVGAVMPSGGIIGLVIDMPTSATIDRPLWGSRKTVQTGDMTTSGPMIVERYDPKTKEVLATIPTNYHPMGTIERVLEQVGFATSQVAPLVHTQYFRENHPKFAYSYEKERDLQFLRAVKR